MDDVIRKFGETIYHQLFECLPNVLVVTDKLGKIIVTNSRLKKLFGYPPTELVGWSIEMLIAERCRHNFTRQQNKILANPRVSSTNIDGELYGRHQDGHEFPIEITLSFLKIKNSCLFIHTIHDISKQHQALVELRESENRFRQLSNVTFEGIAIHKKGTIIDANQTLADMFGYTLSEFIGMNALECTAPESRELLLKKILSGYEKPYEAVGLRKDGSTFPVEIIGKTETYHAHAIRVAAIRDITQRKRAEETLEASEKKYRQLFESTLDGIVMTDKNGRVLTANPAAVKILGFRRERDLTGKSAIDFYSNPEDRHRILDKLMKEDALSDIEVEGKKKDGSVFNVIVSFRLHKDETGNLHHVESIFKDITERKRAEEVLRESEEKFRSLAEKSPNMIYINCGGKVVYVNEISEEIMGYKKDEFYSPAFNFLNLVAPESRNLAIEAFKKHMLGEEVPPYEYTLITKDGKKVEAINATRLIKYDGKQAILGITTDITERKQAEEKLRFLSQITEQVSYSVLTTNLKFEINWINRAFQDLYGYSLEEVLGRTPDFLNAETTSQHIQNDIYQTVSTGKIWKGEVLNAKKDGPIFPCELTIFPIADENGNIFAYGGHQQDLTERKKAEEALRESEEKFRSLAEKSPNMIYINMEGKVVYVNEKSEEIMGYKKEEFYSDKFIFLNLVAPESRNLAKEAFSKHLKGEEISPFEYTLVTKEGGKIEVINTTRLIKYGGKQAILGIITDITDRKLAEKAIKSSYKQVRDLSAHLQSVRDEERAHMAREIHDELGQTLTALKMDLAWLLRKIPEGHTLVSEKMNSMKLLIDRTIESIHEITAKLRPKLLDDLGLIEAMSWLALDTQKRSGITCDVSTNIEEIDLDKQLATAIYRIYQETLTNVVRHSKATRIKISLNKINGQLYLKVKDNGKGITQNELKKSTSFGLIGIRERVHAWGGKVEIKGIQNKGTRVSVTIPLD